MTNLRTPILIAALVACGDDGVHHLADSGVDAPAQPQPDAPPDAAPLGMVTVTVTLQSSPAAGVPVYFQNADSSLVSSATTGDDGTATAMMAAGGFVTVLEPQFVNTARFGSVTNVDGQILDTFSGVKPGDSLHVDVQPGTNTTDVALVNFTIPQDGAAADYTLFSKCSGSTSVFTGGSGTPQTQVEFVGCGGTADILVVSSDDVGNLLDSMFQPAVVIADGGSVTLTQTYSPVVQQTYAQTNVPATVSDVESQAILPSLQFDGPTDDEFGTGGSDSETVAIPTTNATTTVANLTTYFPNGSPVDQQFSLTWGPQPTGEVDTDFSTVRLRNWVTRAAFDVVKNQVAWVVDTTGGKPDTVTASFRVNRNDPVNGGSSWTWRVANAGTANGAVPLPTLPTDIFDFNVHDTDNTFIDAATGIVSPGGYDAARATIFDVEQQIEDNDPEAIATSSATGQIYVQIFQQFEDIAKRRTRHHHPTLRHSTGHGIGIVSSLFPALRSTR